MKRIAKWTIQNLAPAAMTALAIFYLSACSGGSSGTGSFDSGLEKSRQIQTASADELAGLCRRLQKYILKGDGKNAVCTLTGLFAEALANEFEDPTAGDQKVMCEDIRHDCLAARPALDTSSCVINGQQALLGCAVTVAEVENCLTAYTDNFIQVMSGITCETGRDPANLEIAVNSLQKVPEVPECVSVLQRCPNLFNDQEEPASESTL